MIVIQIRSSNPLLQILSLIAKWEQKVHPSPTLSSHFAGQFELKGSFTIAGDWHCIPGKNYLDKTALYSCSYLFSWSFSMQQFTPEKLFKENLFCFLFRITLTMHRHSAHHRLQNLMTLAFYFSYSYKIVPAIHGGKRWPCWTLSCCWFLLSAIIHKRKGT